MSSVFQAYTPVSTFVASSKKVFQLLSLQDTVRLAVICLQHAWHVLSRPFYSTY